MDEDKAKAEKVAAAKKKVPSPSSHLVNSIPTYGYLQPTSFISLSK